MILHSVAMPLSLSIHIPRKAITFTLQFVCLTQGVTRGSQHVHSWLELVAAGSSPLQPAGQHQQHSVHLSRSQSKMSSPTMADDLALLFPDMDSAVRAEMVGLLAAEDLTRLPIVNRFYPYSKAGVDIYR